MKKFVSRTEWQKLALLTIVPEVLLVAIICLARLSGSLQFLELFLFDRFLQWRPSEPIDERITIIGIDEEDIREIGAHPIPDRDLAELLNQLNEYQPRAIGLDIARNLPVEPGYQELEKTFREIPNLIGVESVLNEAISPPPALPPEQIGFVDALTDSDGKYRRSLLATFRPGSDELAFSFSFLLAEEYLKTDEFSLTENLLESDFENIGDTPIPQLVTNTGSYADINDFGLQILLNFRNTRGKERFRTLSFRDIKNGNFDPDWIRDRIIIIGMTAASTPDYVDTVAIADLQLPGKIRGVEFIAHQTSQIISAVLNERPLLKSWSEMGEFLWILVWMGLTIFISLSIRSPLQRVAGISISMVIFLGFSYCLLLLGFWIPVVPILLIRGSSMILTRAIAYRQNVKYEIWKENQLSQERKNAIDNTFNQIHNGPLQTLHILLTKVRNDALNKEELIRELEGIDLAIRDLDKTLSREPLNKNEIFRLGNGVKIDLNLPLHELLAEVYRETITRDFPNFKTLKVTIPQFEAIEAKNLSFEKKRKICQFLEEVLCNVGKHAKNATRLSVMCKKEGSFYRIFVRDNGKSNKIKHNSGNGTRQMREIAGILGGNFTPNISPNGSECELKWPLEKNNLGVASIEQVLRSFIRYNRFKSHGND